VATITISTEDWMVVSSLYFDVIDEETEK